eukprot:TRINITY_DN3114_c0_g1_i2.p1 TRINITY_DN3114_c0_g1~~TRINITY_DN3114_c0_g1_i2.p1  ORF type:complete len:270 (-),score=86.94 TRINITY_DN3114_c0_g1_i2:60-869(-)
MTSRGTIGVKGIDAAVDPFYAMRDNLASRLQAIQRDYDTWKSMMDSGVNTQTDVRFKEIDQPLRVSVKAVFDEAKMLGKAVSSIEKHRENFSHVDDRELAERSAFVKNSKTMLKRIQDEFDSDATKARYRQDTMGALKGDRQEVLQRKRSQDRYDALRQAEEDEKDDQIKVLQHQQQFMIDSQNVVLDDMASALKRLTTQATIINNELEAQDDMLDELGGKLDEAQGRVEINIQKLERLMKTKKRWQLWVIISMILVLAILIFVLFTMK